VNPLGGPEAGDPCDVTTGQFTLASTDLSVRDVLSFDVTRVYRPNDGRVLPFGIGTNWPFAMYISGFTGASVPLVMANGTRIYFDSANNKSGHGEIWINSTTPGPFFGAEMNEIDSLPPYVFTIRRRDGTLYTFDGAGNLIEIRARTGAAITVQRNASAQVTKITSPSGRWIAFTYNAAGLVSQVQDNAARTVSYAYTSNRLTSVTNANGDVWSYTYDANGRMSTVVDPRHNTMLANTYDSNGRVATQTYADGSSIQFAYTVDTNGNVTQTDVTDRNGSVRRVQTSATGDILQDTFPLGAPEQQVMAYTRDSISHLLLSKTDALNRRTDYAYDNKGNMVSVTRLAGTANASTTTYTYESVFNRALSATDPLGRTTTFGYDVAGNLTQVTDPLGHATAMTYDASGQRLTVTNALNQTTSFAYDAGVISNATDSLNRTTSMVSDPMGRVTRVTDALGEQTATSYDALDRVTQVVDSLGNSVNYEYDANGNMTAYVDPKGNRNVYTYDAMNRLTGRQDPLLHAESYQYDPSSMVKQLTDRAGQVTGYNYDSLHRRTQIGFGATSTNPTAYTSTIGYSYDAGNRLLVATDSTNGVITRSYDDLNRLVQEITPSGTVSYTYYTNGLRQTMTVSGQPAVAYTYDNANRLTAIAQGSLAVTFGYDNANRPTQITLPNGIATNYVYDAAGQISSITYVRGGTTLGNLNYAYDGAGRRTTIGGSFAQSNLPGAIANTSHNADNQLTQWGTATLVYDANGNLVSDGTYVYTWNARNQLVQFSQGGSTIAAYLYDSFGRRRQKTVRTVTTQFLYDRGNFVQEQDGTGAVIANLVTGFGLDGVYSRTRGTTTWSFLVDHLGSIIAETDAAGAIQTTYSYEPYGNTTQIGAASDNSQRYTAREQDVAELYYYRARYYAPALERFISEDPIGIDERINIYAYVDGDPLNFVDPSGAARVPKPKPPRAEPPWDDAADHGKVHIPEDYQKICTKAECEYPCHRDDLGLYYVTAWAPPGPTVAEAETLNPNCRCIESVWPKGSCLICDVVRPKYE
jgi:RHS repeat-associated protein